MRENAPCRRPLLIWLLLVGGPLTALAQDPLTASSNRADAFFTQNRFQEAADEYFRLLRLAESTQGRDSDWALYAADSLGVTYINLGRLKDSATYYQHALKLREGKLGPDHPDVAATQANLGQVYRDLERFAEAEALLKKSLQTRKTKLGAEHEDTAQSMSRLGTVYILQSRFAEAEPLMKQSLRIRETKLGANHLDVAASLSNLSHVSWKLGRYDEADRLQRRALKIYEAQGLGQELDAATLWNNIGVVYRDQGKYAESIPPIEKALKIREQKLGREHSDVAVSLRNLGDSLSDLGKYAQAEPHYKRALAIHEKTLGAQHQETLYSVESLATAYFELDRYKEAEPLFLRQLAAAEKPGGEYLDKVGPLSHLARLYQAQGKFSQSEAAFTKSLQESEKKFGADHPEVAALLSSLGSVYSQQGRYPDAERTLRRSLKIYETKVGADHPHTATVLNSLGDTLDAQGRFKEAEAHYQRGLKIREAKLPAGHTLIAGSLGSLAVLYQNQQRYAEAERLHRRALAIEEKNFGPSHLNVATLCNNLAVVLEELNQLAEAERLNLRCIKIREEKLGPDHPALATTLNNLGNIYQRQKRVPEAERLNARAVKIFETKHGFGHPLVTLGLQNQAYLNAFQNKLPEAMDAFDRARRSARRHVAVTLPHLTEAQQRDFLLRHDRDALRAALSLGLLANTRPADLERSASWLLNGKGTAHAALAQRALLTCDVQDPKLAPLVTQIETARRKAAELSLSAPAGKEATAAREKQIDDLARQEADALQKLAQAGGSKAAATEWVELDSLRRALAADAILINIGRFDVYNFAATRDDASQAWKPARYVAWIIPARGRGDVKLIDLGEAEESEWLIVRVRTGIQAAANGTIVKEGEAAAAASVTDDLRALADRVWKPLAAHVPAGAKIHLSPDGALWLVPWAALPVDDKLLLERHSLDYCVTGRELVERVKAAANGPAAVLANPDFEQSAADKKAALQTVLRQVPATTATKGFTAESVLGKVGPLPGTAAEAAAITPSLQKLVGAKPQLYAAKYALESVVKRLQRPRVVVCATHGYFLPEQEIQVSAAAAPPRDARGSRFAEPVDATGKSLENPLLRCGLLFAGCNRRQEAVGDDDGVLTGLEIVGADFRGTELVVLSACETGLGDVRQGEGVAGLRQAFQLAGAQCVVSSLWSVPDHDTALIMSDFFAGLAAGQSRSAALRAAQLKRIAERREKFGAAHPLYWAAWTVTGE